MSTTHNPVPLTFEQLMASFQEVSKKLQESNAASDLRKQEADLQMKEIREQMRKTNRLLRKTDMLLQETVRVAERTSKEVGKITGSMGKVIEHMVGGDFIIKQFQEKFGYIIESYSRNKTFGRGAPNGLQGEIDLFLENGEIAILMSVKTKLRAKDVYDHTIDIEKFRRVADIKGDKRRFIGAVAGAVVEEDAMKLALENGIYVIVQSGKAVKIVETPEGFQAKEW